CTLVSKLYENPAGQVILDARKKDAASSEEMIVEAGVLSEYSPVDGLCEGCNLFSLLRVNPIEEIIYELMNEEKTIVVTDLEEKSIESMPNESLAGAVDEITELPFAVEADETQATVLEPFVINVSEDGLETARQNSEAERHDILVFRGSDTNISHAAEIATPSDNRTPTKEEYSNMLEIVGAKEPVKSEVLVASEAEIGLPIYVRKDIEIKVYFSGNEEGMSFRLVKKNHPMSDEKYVETDITETLDEIVLAGESGLRKMFSLSKAGKGAYSFLIMSSNAKFDGIDVEVLLHKGLKSERLKEYDGIEVAPGAAVEFRFLLPEAVFWDDDNYFSGTIERSRYITKFDAETGLIWKERTSR
nr:hypothetical protein [Candidatus Aenigmarchaeota archaeon]